MGKEPESLSCFSVPKAAPAPDGEGMWGSDKPLWTQAKTKIRQISTLETDASP